MAAQHSLDKYIVRFPKGMREAIKSAAKKNGRSMNAEIVARLTTSDTQLDRIEAVLARLEALSSLTPSTHRPLQQRTDR